MLKSTNNFINFNILNENSVYNVDNNSNLKSLKKIFFNWDIVFFKLTNLKKSKNILIFDKIFFYNTSYICFFFNFFNILNFLNLNKKLLTKNIYIYSIFYKNYYINLRVLNMWGYSFKLFTHFYWFLFLKLVFSLFFNFIFLIFFKLLNFLRFIFLPCLNL